MKKCKVAKKIYNKKYYQKNKDRISKQKKEYSLRPEVKLQKYNYMKKYYRDNIGKRRECNRKIYLKNKIERCKKQREYRKNNLERVKESDRRTYYKYKKHRDIPTYGSSEHIRKLQTPKSTNGYFQKYLQSLNFYFITEFTPFISNRKFRADFFIPSLNLCIDIHGNYWHDYKRFPEKEREDNYKPVHLKELGYNYIVIKEDNLKKFML